MTTAPRYPLIDETCLTRLGVMVVQGPHQAHLTPGDLSRAVADLDELDCEVAHVKGHYSVAQHCVIAGGA